MRPKRLLIVIISSTAVHMSFFPCSVNVVLCHVHDRLLSLPRTTSYDRTSKYNAVCILIRCSMEQILTHTSTSVIFTYCIIHIYPWNNVTSTSDSYYLHNPRFQCTSAFSTAVVFRRMSMHHIHRVIIKDRWYISRVPSHILRSSIRHIFTQHNAWVTTFLPLYKECYPYLNNADRLQWQAFSTNTYQRFR